MMHSRRGLAYSFFDIASTLNKFILILIFHQLFFLSFASLPIIHQLFSQKLSLVFEV
jgi:hypothetical protein